MAAQAAVDGQTEQQANSSIAPVKEQENKENMTGEADDNSSDVNTKQYTNGDSRDSNNDGNSVDLDDESVVQVTEMEDGRRITVTSQDVPPFGRSKDLVDQLGDVKGYIYIEYEKLMSMHLKDYDGMSRFRTRVSNICEVYKDCENYLTDFSEKLSQVCSFMTAIRQGLDTKLESEGIETWRTDSAKDITTEEKNADEKLLVARVTSSKAYLEEVKLELVQAKETASEARATANCAALEADEATNAAKDAIKRAEEAKRLAEERAREQEEALRKAEEKARKKAEEERLRREEEERRQMEQDRLKGTPEEIERRRVEEEKKRQEAQRRDPGNWPRFIYNIDPGEFDAGYGCIVRSWPNAINDKEELTCEKIEQLDVPIQLGENEELVSNIIKLVPSSDDAQYQFPEPMAIAIPHCAPRNIPMREPVIKLLSTTGKWMNLETKEVSFDDIKDAKFVEVRLKRFGTLAVVTRVKVERLKITKKGGKLASSVDSRIQMAIRPGVFRVDTDFTLQVQQVELAAVSDIKARQPDVCGLLIASSPIIHLGMRNRKFVRPIAVTLPIPANPSKAKRPQTARGAKSPSKQSAARPSSAVGFGLGSFGDKSEEDAEDEVWLLRRSEQGEWEHGSKIELMQSKKGDSVTFDLEEPIDRFMILRTRTGLKRANVEKMAKLLETSLNKRFTQIILRQKNDDLSDINVVCAPLNKIERTLRKFSEDGYDEGSSTSKDLEIEEGQEVEIRFRGNILCDEEEPCLRFNYNSQLKSRINMFVAEIDKFAQKSIDCYRGFAQFYTRGLIQQPVYSEDEKSRSKKEKPTKFEWVTGDVLLCEQLISLPKPEPEPPKPIQRAPVTIKADGPIDEKLLRHLASDLGDEWKILAQALNIKRTRIQAILRNNVNSDNEDTIYDMLVTWAKRVPRSMDKVSMLCDALLECGRRDLVDDIRDKEYDFKEQRAQSARDSYLRRAFLKIAQDKDTVNDWKALARKLSILDTDIIDIEAENSNTRDQCFNMLAKWRTNNEENATLQILVTSLKKMRRNKLAEEIRLLSQT